jgi:uncharacterized membrane protein YeaQ/YmgE (transglycosylase-associated protein family)
MVESTRGDVVVVSRRDDWQRWPIWWSAIWVGALAAIATALIIGLIGIAVGAHELGTRTPIVRLSQLHFGAMVFSVFGAFLSFALGSWIAGRIAGIRHPETAMLHGAIVWLIALPMLLGLAALGAGNLFGGWYGDLAGTPIWVTPSTVVADPNAALIARNSALGTVTALLLGLVGAVLGGWMASGEPMRISRTQRYEGTVTRRVA